jgi:hypothetical protein
MKKRRGISYRKRVADISNIYAQHVADGLSNREIWRRYIYPTFGISERTFYNILSAPVPTFSPDFINNINNTNSEDDARRNNK